MRDPLDTRARLDRIRLRALAITLGTGLAVVGVLSAFTIPPLAVIGVAVVTVAALVHRIADRVDEHHCRQCGESLKGLPVGQYGVVCKGCGAINERETFYAKLPQGSGEPAATEDTASRLS